MAVLEFDDAVSRRAEEAYTTADIVAHQQAIRRLLDLQPARTFSNYRFRARLPGR
jgi:hypothetical protein